MTSPLGEYKNGGALGHLSETALAKAERHMRALRRAILSYWYATLEGKHAALIEATNACLVVTILDESVFAEDLGKPYREQRGRSAGGRVVTGLDLVRNCETHSPVSFDDLLVQKRSYSLPLHAGSQVMRAVWHWADYTDLPTDYVGRHDATDASEFQKRACKEAQHGYREGVQGRSVIETLFDAERFFAELEPRLATAPPPTLAHAFAEVPVGAHTVLHRPLEGFVDSVSLPDLATRWDERTIAVAPPADKYVKDLAAAKNRDVPAGEKRIITHKISDGGRVVGYSGAVETIPGLLMNWVERSAQIGRDIRAGFPYVLEFDSGSVPVASSDNLTLSAVTDGRDRLSELAEAPDPRGSGRLRLVEDYPDLYVSMRKGL